MAWNNVSSRRSDVLSRYGAVATNDPIATEVGINILKDGGNAADACVAIAAALNLVDPGSTGLGGDAFVLFYDAKEKIVKGINGSGRSSENLTFDLLEKHGITASRGHHQISPSSGLSVNVPGAPQAWIDTVKMFGTGKFSLSKLFEPTIKLAENGFPTHEFTSYLQKLNAKKLQDNENSFGEDLKHNGEAPEHGQIMKNPNYARTLKILGEKGADGFYDGEIAQAIVECVQSAGGCLTRDDLKNHRNTYDEPISTIYKGIKVFEMPPNGQGLVALMGLNILEGCELSKETDRFSSSCLHQMIESMQLAFADGFKHICDQEKQKSPLEKLLSKEFAAERRKLMKENSAKEHYYPATVHPGDDTVYFSVVDDEGNACSFINSIYHYHGSGLVPKNCGFALQCRGSNFSLDKSHPNCVGPSKRTYHTIIPGMAVHADTNDLYACFGVMGGFMQPNGHLQVLSNMIDFGMTPQQAICFPRFNIEHYPDRAPEVYLEEGLTEECIKELKEKGHQIKVIKGMDRTVFGRGQIIQVRKDKMGNRVLWSGSESRTDGCAMGINYKL